MLDAVVQSHRGRPDAADNLLGEPRGLLSDRGPDLGAGRDLAQGALRLLTGEHPVGQLEGAGARKRRREQALELTARGELVDDPLEDAVSNDGAGDLLGQWSRERAVDDPRHLRSRQNIVHGLLELVAPDSRGGPGREHRCAAGCVAQPRTLLVR